MRAAELVRKRVKDPGDFEWLKQCRFYWRDDKDTVIISICDRNFEYSFEYLGGGLVLLGVCRIIGLCEDDTSSPIFAATARASTSKTE